MCVSSARGLVIWLSTSSSMTCQHFLDAGYWYSDAGILYSFNFYKNTSPNLMDKLCILIYGVACYEKLECNPLFPQWASKEFRER